MISSKTLPEDVPIGTHLGTFKATDGDVGLQSTVTYTLLPNLGYLAIDNKDGVLKVAAILDRETTPQIKVNIVATDNAPSEFRKSTKHTFTLLLSDLNDNAPHFAFNSSTEPFIVKETVAIGLVGMTATATDKDDGDNARMTYTLLARNDNGIFDFDQTSARFIVKGTLSQDLHQSIAATNLK